MFEGFFLLFRDCIGAQFGFFSGALVKMESPGISELPPPPAGKTGWPWTSDGPAKDNGPSIPLPVISLVTPSYNQGQFIERTIRSVLLQGYPNLEYFIIDGGSTDETVDIIRKYEPWLSGWTSEPDRGQSHAINKGFARCSGEVINWLNSDDLLAKDALSAVGHAFVESPDTDIVLGLCRREYLSDPHAGHLDRPLPSMERVAMLPVINPITQPSCFIRRAIIQRDPVVDESLHYTMDFDLVAYCHSRQARWKIINDVLSVFVFWGENKTLTGGWKWVCEIDRIYRRYKKQPIPLSFWVKWVRFPLECLHVRYRQNVFFRKPLTAALHAYIELLSPLYGRENVEIMSLRWIPESWPRQEDNSVTEA